MAKQKHHSTPQEKSFSQTITRVSTTLRYSKPPRNWRRPDVASLKEPSESWAAPWAGSISWGVLKAKRAHPPLQRKWISLDKVTGFFQRDLLRCLTKTAHHVLSGPSGLMSRLVACMPGPHPDVQRSRLRCGWLKARSACPAIPQPTLEWPVFRAGRSSTCTRDASSTRGCSAAP